ncbi:MAG: hypothetical protein K6V36_02165 [Anaerolineae bacterium]|nr:hypothetical protein [Anaerolineae bacterium]
MAKLVLKRDRRKRLEAGHPWVFRSEVAKVEGELEPGGLADIVNHQGVFLAKGFVNPKSQIVARLLTYRRDEPVDQAFFRDRVAAAWRHRVRFLNQTDACRAVYGEADFLPGLIVDKYGPYLVVQILALGMEVRKADILAALQEVFHPAGIFLRNDVPVRSLEGLPLETVSVEVTSGPVAGSSTDVEVVVTASTSMELTTVMLFGGRPVTITAQARMVMLRGQGGA